MYKQKKNVTNFPEFEDKELRTLLQHFDSVLKQAGVNVLEAEIGWTMLKKGNTKEEIYPKYIECSKLLNNISCEKLVKLLCLNCSDLLRSDWVLVQRKYENKFSNILAVIDLIFTMSPSSADAERGFSQLKCLKQIYELGSIRSHLIMPSLSNSTQKLKGSQQYITGTTDP